MTLLLAALLWPIPCMDSGTCWLAWNAPTDGVVVRTYEIWSGDKHCATIYGHYTQRGRWVTPRRVYWPYPGDGCWDPEKQITYHVRACNEWGCGGWVEEIPFGPQPFMCFDSQGQIPCS